VREARIIALLAVLVITGTLAFASYTERRSCEAHGRGLGYPSRYGWWAGCSFQIGGRWIPENRLVVTEDGTILEVTRTTSVPA
jgi:hypothetical protein